MTGPAAIRPMSFAQHLAALDVKALTRVLASRSDLLVEPVPRALDELAQRLCGCRVAGRGAAVDGP